MDNYVENYRRLLGEFSVFYASVYNHSDDISRRGSILIRPTRFCPIIASIKSQDDSFIGHQNCFNIFKW